MKGSRALFRSILTLCTLTFSFAQNSFAQRISSSDFDNDGYSDFVLINANNNVLIWSAIKSDGSVQQSIGEFGRLGFEIAMGDYLGTNLPQPATVTESKGKLIWRIFSNNTSIAKEFGSAGQTALAGGDFNMDGRIDATVVSANAKKLNWKIHQSLFTDSAAAALDITFGKAKDLYFFSNPDGKGDRLTTLSNERQRGFLLRYYSVTKNSISRKLVELVVPSGQLKNRPLPLSLSSGKDGLLFYKKGKSVTNFSVYRPGINKLLSFRMRATGDVVVGNFTADPGEEVAVQTEGGFIIFSPATRKTTTIAAPSGIVVDEVNINRIGKTSNNNGGGGSGGGNDTPPPNEGEPPPAGLRTVCESYSAITFGEMLIKSEISNHIPGVDPRATGYTLVCGSICPKNLSRTDFFYSDGSYAGSVAYYGTFSGNGKPRMYGAVGQAPQHFADQIAAKASTIGNGKLYMQMSAARSGAGTMCKEFNGTGRNGGLY